MKGCDSKNGKLYIYISSLQAVQIEKFELLN